jgi:CubicO group peptidase (beta-lactamase class C family)
MKTARVPGLSTALVKDGALLWRRAFGVKDIRTNAPVDTDAVFEAASTTKPVFAYAVMKLCERGVFDLDVPLTKYTSDRLVPADARLDQITARHVLSHTGGLPNWRSKKAPLAIAFTPGERWSYSGEGYSYLQAVVTRLAGGRVNPQSCAKFELGVEVCAIDPNIDDYMQASLFRPFGMSSSGLLWTERMERNIAWGHDPKGQPLERSRKPNGPALARYGVAGGMSTTPTDYAKFLIEIVAPKPADAFRLTRASLDEMLRPQIKLAPESSWALGWKVHHTAAGDFISHGGGNPGYSCFVAASPQRKSGYVIMTNSEENGFYGLIAKLIAGDTLGGFLGAKLEG